MADSLRDLVVSLSLNTDNFTRNIKSVNKQIQEAESYFKLASAGVKDFDTSAAGLTSKLEMLERKLTLQRDAVTQYERALTAATSKLSECYQRQEDYAQRLADARDRQEDLRMEVETATLGYEHYRDTLGETDSATIAARQNMEAAQQEYAEATAEVEQLAGQNDALRRSTQNAADAVSTAQTQLNRAQAAVRETEAAIRDTNAQLRTAQSAWTAAGKALTEFGDRCEKIGRSAEKIGRTLTATVTTPIVALGTTAVKASMEFESAFADVQKVTTATCEEFAQLSSDIKSMSTRLAASTTDIAAVVTSASRLGIQTDKLMDFTEVMINLGNSTDMAADEAATSMARFANIMGMDQSLFSNMGSTLVALGNNYATTESEIMAMAQRMAGAGKQVGLSEAQVLGFSAALSAVGIEAQMGGSAFSKALVKMEVASATGGQALDDFAKVCGMTSGQFKTLWDNDPAAAFQAFILGLAQMDEAGISAIAVLDEIGISEIRLRDTILRATNATELFSNTQATANAAWNANTELTTVAEKRYATTASKLTNLKNTAMLFAQTIGDDLNPTVQKMITGIQSFLEKLLDMDESERKALIQNAIFAASIGPAVLAFGKMTTGIGKVAKGLGTFATAVGKAGGGFTGFLSVLGKSPAVWAAVAIAVVAGTIALVDYASGAKKAREALEGMAETAKKWKDTAADTFYGKSGAGLSFFGMSTDDFTKESAHSIQAASDWYNGLIAVWTDGKRETNAIVKEWTDSWKTLTASTREGLTGLKETADANGYTGLSSQIQADIDTLDAMDKEIAALLKKRQSKLFTEEDQRRLQELITARGAIEIKYHLVEADSGGFDTIRDKMAAEVARAQARGESDADVSVYQNAIVAAGQGMATVNAQIDAQYDKEFALIQLIEDSTERQAAMDDLNARYLEQRRQAAMEYGETLAGFVMPVWNSESMQTAGDQMDRLVQLMRQYYLASESERPAILAEMDALSSEMDESALTEYYALLTQIQSLLDSGLSEPEVQAMFPDIDFSSALEQLASIQSFLNTRSSELPGLSSMFGEALPEEVLTIATDLDMTGAQSRWDEFASNPGAITTEAIIAGFAADAESQAQQPMLEAFISKYTEVPEGADKSALTVDGLIAYVGTYAEVVTGADVSGLNPTNVTAMVSAYKELAEGTDVSTLKPSEIVAYITKYCEDNKVDISGLTPEGITAFVLAYEEATGGALTTALKPSDVTAMVVRYLEAEGVDISKLTSAQVDGIVTAFAEATNCDKSQLLQDFTAHIVRYDDSGATRPNITTTVGIYGYDLIAYRKFMKANPIEVDGILKLSEVYQNPTDALSDPNAHFYKDGIEIPVETVPSELLTANRVAVLGTDGAMHILIAADVTGAEEAIAELRTEVAEVDQFGTTALGRAVGLLPTSTMDLIDSAMQRMAKYKEGGFWNWLTGATNKGTLDFSMNSDFNADRVSELSTYVAEVVSAIAQGKEVKQEDLENLQTILSFLQELDTTDTGTHILEGVAEGMTAAGWDSDAETVASNLETALNAALDINSPSERMKPTGDYVAQGVGAGMAAYDFSTDAAAMASAVESAVGVAFTADTLSTFGTSAAQGLASAIADYSMTAAGSSISSNVQSAVSSSLTGTSLRSVGVNAMAGLRAGILAGQSGVISAMRSAAQAAVNAAKTALKIHSPSRVFRDDIGAMTMRGFGEGILDESRDQARIIRNASRFLTEEAKESAIAYGGTDNRKTYNQQSSVNLSGNTFYIRDDKDVQSLAVEIATLTRRRQHGRGLKMA